MNHAEFSDVSDGYVRVVDQLTKAGMSGKMAEQTIAMYAKGSIVDGAIELQKKGAIYSDAFMVLSAQSKKTPAPASRRLKYPRLMILAGGIMSLAGSVGVLRGFSIHDNAAIIDHGITLSVGIICCVLGLANSVRK